MNHPDDQDPNIDATGPGGIFEPSIGSTYVKPTGDQSQGAVAALTPWDGSEPLMVAAYGLAPTPISPRDLNPLLRPLTPVPTIPADQVVKDDHGVKIPTGSKPSPSSVVAAITYVRQHFNLVLPPQDSRIQALASLLDLAADVGSAR